MRVTVVGTGRKLRFTSSTVLTSGGEANIHVVPDLVTATPTGQRAGVPQGAQSSHTAEVAKIYRRPTADRAEKLALMLASPPDDPQRSTGHCSLVWPTDLLRDDGGRIVGFLMPRLRGVSPLIDFFNPLKRLQQRPHCNYMYLHRLARNLAQAVAAVHDRLYTIGDINESNCMGTDTALITLVDNDSFQVVDVSRRVVHRCLVGKPDFTPPELQGVPFSSVNREPKHDHFGLAVLIFQLLMEGTHPYAGIYVGAGEPTGFAERIRNGDCPHINRSTGRIRPAPLAPPFAILPPALRRLFCDAFTGGSAVRPNARDWATALATAEQSLERCSSNGEHLFAPHLPACPWCERREHMGGIDPFPAPGALRPPVLENPGPIDPTIVTPREKPTVPTLPPRIAARHPRTAQAVATSFAAGANSPSAGNTYRIETIGESLFSVMLFAGIWLALSCTGSRHRVETQQITMILGSTLAIMGAVGKLFYYGRAVVDVSRREIIVSAGFSDNDYVRTIPFGCVRGVAVDCREHKHGTSYALRVIATGVDGVTIKTATSDLASINQEGRDLAGAVGATFYPGARGRAWELLGNKIDKRYVAPEPGNIGASSQVVQFVLACVVMVFMLLILFGR